MAGPLKKSPIAFGCGKEFLEALEDMNVKLLPGKAYALAFLKSYARELGMDEKAILDQFQDESALTREDANKQIRNPSSKPRRERPVGGRCGPPGHCGTVRGLARLPDQQCACRRGRGLGPGGLYFFAERSSCACRGAQDCGGPGDPGRLA